ncbi:Pvc16 family protein [Enterobacter bugandensis]|uniref:Pvc16 family protein n=1 Tax=Enterobacter bugandensis TaxID=881260 RepID=UPI002FCF5795
MQHIKQHVPENVEIRFDAPDADSPPATPTLHLFLYLIHEDLSVRHSPEMHYHPGESAYDLPGASLRCLYLVTYWDQISGSGGSSPAAQPDSPSVVNLTSLVKALLCMRRHKDFRDYLVRIIEPEALNSLGNFWQALNNKPRAIINFAITLPVTVSHPDEPQPLAPPVRSVENRLILGADDLFAGLERLLFNRLLETLGSKAEAQRSLVKVSLAAYPKAAFMPGTAAQQAGVVVSGVVLKEVHDQLASVIESWQGETAAVGGQEMVLNSVINQLVAI